MANDEQEVQRLVHIAGDVVAGAQYCERCGVAVFSSELYKAGRTSGATPKGWAVGAWIVCASDESGQWFYEELTRLESDDLKLCEGETTNGDCGPGG